MNCEECEDELPRFFCPKCGQQLCEPCDKKIHNKGKRVLHIREPILDQVEMKVPGSNNSSITAVKEFSSKDLVVHSTPPKKIDAHTLRHQQHQERFNSINQNMKMKSASSEESKVSNTGKKSIKRLNIQAPSLEDMQDVPSENVYKFKECDGFKYYAECYFRNKAGLGELMVNIDDFKNYMKQKPDLFKNNLKNNVEELEKCGLIHITIRRFGDSEPLKFLSLLIDQLTIESLVWVLKAIRKDEMTPTDKLIQSRVKECFGMKLPAGEWAQFMNNFQKFPNGIARHYVRGKQILIKVSQCPFSRFFDTSNINNQEDNQNTQETLFLITIEDNIEWKMQDAQQVTSEHSSLWKLFIKFLKDFFDSPDDSALCNTSETYEQINLSNSSSSQYPVSEKQGRTQQDFKWIRSVEHNERSQDLTVSSQMNQSYMSQQHQQKRRAKKSLIKPPRSIQKAIPGGKYGCAQLLKCCGPLQLKICSLGLLCLLIQEAISRNILIYYKTLLIKPNQNVAFDFDEFLNLFENKDTNQINENFQELKISIQKQQQLQDQAMKVNLVKQVVLEVLNDQQKGGVSLARLPKMIQRRITFQFDLHELGFTKLKSFLQSIPEVEIENDGTTFASVVLKQVQMPIENSTNQYKQAADLSPCSYNKKFQTMKPDGSGSRFFASYFQRNMSNVQDYQKRVNMCLQQLVCTQPYGIDSNMLHTHLNQHLQTQFDFSIFGCKSFEDYLVKYAESYADVMIKRHGCVVYAKGIPGWSQQQIHAYQQMQYYQNQLAHQFSQYPKYQQTTQSGRIIHHQKSQSTNLTSGQNQNLSSCIIKAESFLAGMQPPPDLHSNQSLTFQSVNTTPINREFFMIQEEESHLELDENLKFIDELLKESDEIDSQKEKAKNNNNNNTQKPPQIKKNLMVWPQSPSSTRFTFHTKTGGYMSPRQPFPQVSPRQHQLNHINFPPQISPRQQHIMNFQVASLHSWDFDNQNQQT